MTHGLARFDFFLNQLQEHLNKAVKEPNPAAWLFVNGSRTPLFMLEALGKLYSNLHNKNLFTKIKNYFKELEDILGDIDYYEGYIKEFSIKGDIPASVISFLQKKKSENEELLNSTLIEKKWINSKDNRINKIRKKLKEAEWMEEDQEINAIKEFYQESIAEINAFYLKTGGKFSDMEEEVHSLRRKLRWLSIYPHALRGSIQLTDNNSPDEKFTKYLIPETINSPFNKMPDGGEHRYFLMLEKNNFYALSWIIAELGKLKDAGLAYEAMEEANVNKNHDPDINEGNYPADLNAESVNKILSGASDICRTYFEEQNLEKLVAGVKCD